jgi:hypothetical protein
MSMICWTILHQTVAPIAHGAVGITHAVQHAVGRVAHRAVRVGTMRQPCPSRARSDLRPGVRARRPRPRARHQPQRNDAARDFRLWQRAAAGAPGFALSLAAEPRAHAARRRRHPFDLFHFSGDAFPNEEAAAKWRQRNPFDEDRVRILIADDPRPYSKVTWQPNGQGQKVRRSIVPTAAVGALRRAALSSFRSGLRSWQVEQFTGGEQAHLPSAAPIDTSGACPGHRKAEPPSKRLAPEWQGETRVHPPDG